MSGKIRRAQTVTTFGVGSVVDVDGEGFVVLDTGKWVSNSYQAIDLPILSQALGNKRLRGFGTNEKEQCIPVKRFPGWYFCSRKNCRTLRQVRPKEDFDSMRYLDDSAQQDASTQNDDTPMPPTPKCKRCKKEMSPMRWVAYCDNGHLSDIDWYRWCHQGSQEAQNGQCTADSAHLKFHSTGRFGGDFDQMYIECECGAKQNLANVIRHEINPYVIYAKAGKKCTGRQPWQRGDDYVDCEMSMKIEPRGSSSMYRARTLSALDLRSCESDFESSIDEDILKQLYKLREKVESDMEGLGQAYEIELADPDSKSRAQINFICELNDLDEETIIDWFSDKFAQCDPDVPSGEEIEQKDLLMDEYNIFKEHTDVRTPNLYINYTELSSETGELIGNTFSHIGAVRKLREVRVFTGFSRGVGNEIVPPDLKGEKDWLPAVEAWGEGIYFELNTKTLSTWLDSHGDGIRQALEAQYKAFDKFEARTALQIEPSPIFFLTHTLAHLLIRELTFRSGYSSSALRERIYVDASQNHAAILIYTTDSDSEGTLGGLVEQASVENLSVLVEKVSNAGRWCSADPVCRETESQGLSGLNASACHCCSLISETSCAYQNAGLNRLMLGGLGDSQEEPLGFFEYILKEIG